MHPRPPLHAAVAALGLVALAAPAASAHTVRTLLLDQRITPTLAPPSSSIARSSVVLAGDTFAFQIAVKPSAAITVHPSIDATDAPWLSDATTFLRVGFVRIRKPSSGTGARAGLYPDPLPQFTRSGLRLTKGLWGGIVVRVRVPADTPAGTLHTSVTLATGGTPITVPVTLRVSRLHATALDAPSSFRVLFLDNAPIYTAAVPLRGATSADRRAANIRLATNLLGYLADHGATQVRYPFASPDASGRYPSYSEPGAWWKDSAGNLARALQVSTAARIFPVDGRGFSIDGAALSRVRAFLTNAFRHWSSRGYLDRTTYAFVTDEPSHAEEASKVPALNRAVHAAAPGVKTLMTIWPQVVVKPRRICKTWGDHACFWSRGNDYSNEHLWNGGSDDTDALVVLDHRYYGRWSSPLELANRIDHTLETYRLVQRARSRGKQIFGYEYSIGVRHLPQLSIDAPATDVSTLLWWNAKERNTGFLHWGYARFVKPGSSVKRDPYVDPLSWQSNGVTTNGEASLIYPAYAPQYGLRDAAGVPVTSLRMERLALGVENANLVQLARTRLGDAAVDRLLGRIFGTVAKLPRGGYTWPSYSTNPFMYEQVRRQLITALERA